MNMLAWLMANWVQVLVALLAVDSALIPIFPNAGLLVSIKNILFGVTPKQQ
jgi:hypothetical protein